MLNIWACVLFVIVNKGIGKVFVLAGSNLAFDEQYFVLIASPAILSIVMVNSVWDKKYAKICCPFDDFYQPGLD